jgi:hypothetical protein
MNRWKSITIAVYWEILRKNRLVFGALGVMLAIGAGLAWAVSTGPAGASWHPQARSAVVLIFLISILIAFAPFTLMESSGGWRMNSMITRWFSLPMPTGPMVFTPLLAACGFLALLVLVWGQILDRIAPGLDIPYFIASLIVAQVSLSAIAWTVPRKPGQFWTLVGLLFPFFLIFALGLQDQPGKEKLRHSLLGPMGVAVLLLSAYAWVAARKNRCGSWPGELPLSWLGFLVSRQPGGSSPRRRFRGPAFSLFTMDGVPALRIVCLSWFALMVCIYVWVTLSLRDTRLAVSFEFWVLATLAVTGFPVLAVVWMALCGIFVGGDPGSPFRSRLASFRATLPVSCGMLAGQKLAAMALAWCVVWLPLALLSYSYDPQHMGVPAETRELMQASLARLMAMGGFVLAGALPLFLRGRVEGFPNFLLAAICTWGALYLLNSNLGFDPAEPPGWRMWIILGLLAVKLGVAATSLVMAARQNLVTWRFPMTLCLGWAAAACLIILVLPLARTQGIPAALLALLYLPLARLALCPLALAANRHRR